MAPKLKMRLPSSLANKQRAKSSQKQKLPSSFIETNATNDSLEETHFLGNLGRLETEQVEKLMGITDSSGQTNKRRLSTKDPNDTTQKPFRAHSLVPVQEPKESKKTKGFLIRKKSEDDGSRIGTKANSKWKTSPPSIEKESARGLLPKTKPKRVTTAKKLCRRPSLLTEGAEPLEDYEESQFYHPDEKFDIKEKLKVLFSFLWPLYSLDSHCLNVISIAPRNTKKKRSSRDKSRKSGLRLRKRPSASMNCQRKQRKTSKGGSKSTRHRWASCPRARLN